MERVRDPTLRREVAVIYASEAFLTDPLTVESLRFITRQLEGNRPKTQEPYDPRHVMRSRPPPFTPVPTNKMLVPQGVLPPVAVAALAVRASMGPCFSCRPYGHFARECLNRNQAHKPTAIPLCPKEDGKATTEDCSELVAEYCSGNRFCLNSGMTDNVASQCVGNPVMTK